MTDTRIDYGDNLLSPGARQPTGSISIDAFGLAQAQLTFAVDSDPGNLAAAIATYSMGVAYPDDLGFDMISYKYHITSAKGGVAMLTVDYMGVARGIGYTDAQITGISNATAQTIESHPNFTEVRDDTIGTGSPTQLLAGTHDALAPGNYPIFNQVENSDGKPAWTFGGFGESNDGSVNIKMSIRQFLKPMWNVRGVIFFNPETADSAATMTNGVGRTLNNIGDVQKLIRPNAVIGTVDETMCLLTAANAECIGTPDNLAAVKVTYDLMISGAFGWDYDIYGTMQEPIF